MLGYVFSCFLIVNLILLIIGLDVLLVVKAIKRNKKDK